MFPRSSYDPSDTFKSNQYYGFTSKNLDQLQKRKPASKTKINFTYEDKLGKQETSYYKSDTASSYTTDKQMDTIKMDTIIDNHEKSAFTQKRNKCIDQPYQTSSLKLKIPTIKKKVSQSCNMGKNLLQLSKELTIGVQNILSDKSNTARKCVEKICG